MDTDDSGRVVRLDLYNNDLTGSIPPELGSLANLTWLYLDHNALTGAIPPSLLQLVKLERFSFEENDGLCAPGTPGFVAWLQGIEQPGSPTFCNEFDVAVLESLYEATSGAGWTNSEGWLGDGAVSEWHGVSADSLGRVTGIDLSRNGLAGELTRNLGELARMAELRINSNALSGRLLPSLTRLALREFHWADTEMCSPAEESFRQWLKAIESHEGTGVECGPPTERDILVALYRATDGPNWVNSDNWLTDAPLRSWYGVVVNGEHRLVKIDLARNNLSGPIPPELGELANLTSLSLGGNNLSGPIPPELGGLANLTSLSLVGNNLSGPIPPELGEFANLASLSLGGNNLSGPIPPELGGLSSLKTLDLWNSELTGPIPPELGNLSSLQRLYLDENALTGPIPPELGNLSSLYTLQLSDNKLTGQVPPEFGRLTNLRVMGLANNAGMSGALPASLTALRRLQVLATVRTDLCAPSDADFLAWLDGVRKRRIAPCVRGAGTMAYLTQAVQSREFPVPLVAGERALLRVFVTAQQATNAGIPQVRATFYLGGGETHVTDIPGKSVAIPEDVDESILSKSSNAEIPGEIVQPGLEMVINIDPEGTLDPALGVTRRIPETGRMAVDVRAMPLLDLTVIPFLWSEAPDSSILDMAKGMASDPENHDLLWHTRTLLPVGDLEVAAHEPVVSSSNSARTIFGRNKGDSSHGGRNRSLPGHDDPARDGGWRARRCSRPVDLLAAHIMAHRARTRTQLQLGTRALR